MLQECRKVLSQRASQGPRRNTFPASQHNCVSIRYSVCVYIYIYMCYVRKVSLGLIFLAVARPGGPLLDLQGGLPPVAPPNKSYPLGQTRINSKVLGHTEPIVLKHVFLARETKPTADTTVCKTGCI